MGEHPVLAGMWMACILIALVWLAIFIDMWSDHRPSEWLEDLTGRFVDFIMATGKEILMAVYPSVFEEAEARNRAEMERIVRDNFPTRVYGSALQFRDSPIMETVTRYNGVGTLTKEQLMASKTLYRVYVVDRRLIESDPLEAVSEYQVTADNPESARTMALLSAGITLENLSNFHLHADAVCQVPFLPKDK